MNIAGIRQQLNILGFFPNIRHRLYVEFGANWGNYCRCYLPPYIRPQVIPSGAFYISWGLGGAFYVHPRFDIGLALNVIHTLGPYRQYTTGPMILPYVLGFSYYIIKR